MTQEQLNALAIEQQIATDNYNKINDRIQAIRNLSQSYLNATPEQQAKAKGAMQKVMDEYNALNGQINDAYGRMNAANENYNNALIQQQMMQQQVQGPTAGQRRRVISNSTSAPVETPNITSNVNIVPNTGVYGAGSVAPTPTVSNTTDSSTPRYNNNFIAGLNNAATDLAGFVIGEKNLARMLGAPKDVSAEDAHAIVNTLRMGGEGDKNTYDRNSGAYRLGQGLGYAGGATAAYLTGKGLYDGAGALIRGGTPYLQSAADYVAGPLARNVGYGLGKAANYVSGPGAYKLGQGLGTLSRYATSPIGVGVTSGVGTSLLTNSNK